MKMIKQVVFLSHLLICGVAAAQGNYPGNAVSINDEVVSYQRFQGFYVEHRNSKGIAVGARSRAVSSHAAEGAAIREASARI